jgi:hypothetical protein
MKDLAAKLPKKGPSTCSRGFLTLLGKVFWLFDFGHLFLSIFENPKYFSQNPEAL